MRQLLRFLGEAAGGVPRERARRGQGLEKPRQTSIPGWPRRPTAYHFHVLSREVLDFLLHPLDALQKVLVLLVHPLVLLHQGLQLDLGLTGAFQLQ